MYLLARAQSLSGRPHDSLVMLRRLAEVGFITAATTDDDFRRVRELRQWTEVEAVIGAVPRTPEVSRPTVAVPSSSEDALRIPGEVVGSAGLAYDRVSSRFVVADARLQKLIVIDEQSRHRVDLVTASSAGFYDITGLEIDPRRGNLWVVSAQPAAAAPSGSPASAVHKLQLVSGRPLDRIPVPADLQPCRLADVAVTRDGDVLLLDTIGNRVLRLRQATRTFTTVATLHVQGSTSLAAAEGRIVYVAYASGIARVDTLTGAVKALANPRDVALDGFERIRWAGDSLVGVQHVPDASQRVVRIRVADTRAVGIDIIDSGTATDRSVVTVSGAEFYFLVHRLGDDADDVVIRRRPIH
ncbi:MAG TPA: hypothetical protein VGJ29_03170 [Vicinamibacterales bacterium]